MTEEIWRPIVGYEGLYEVSSYGRVRSLDRYVKGKSYRLHKGKVLSPGKNSRGYLSAVLSYNGKHKAITVHRLVAEAFLPNPDNLPEVNHKDEDKTNNRVENLEWCNHKYNMNYGTRNIRAKETAIKNGYYTGLSKEEYRKKYRDKNKEKIREKQRGYMREYNKNYYEKNKEKIREHSREYKKNNKEKIREYMREYMKKRKENK